MKKGSFKYLNVVFFLLLSISALTVSSCFSMQLISNNFNNPKCDIVAWPGWLDQDTIQLKATCRPSSDPLMDYQTTLMNAQWAAVSLYADAYLRNEKMITFKPDDTIEVNLDIKAITRGGMIVQYQKLKDGSNEIIFKQPVHGIYVKTELGYKHFPINNSNISALYSSKPADPLKYGTGEKTYEYWLNENTLVVHGFGKPGNTSNSFQGKRMALEAAEIHARSRAAQIIQGALVEKSRANTFGVMTGDVINSTYDADGTCHVLFSVEAKGLKEKTLSKKNIPDLAERYIIPRLSN